METIARTGKRTLIDLPISPTRVSQPLSPRGQTAPNGSRSMASNRSVPHFMEPLNRTPSPRRATQTKVEAQPVTPPRSKKLEKRRAVCDSNPTFFSRGDLPFSKSSPAKPPPKKVYSSNLTVKEIGKLRHGFNLIDKDRDGLITKPDMNRFLADNNLDVTFTDLAFQLFSHNGETLNFDDFKEYVTVMTVMEDKPRIFYKVLFDFIDADGSGGIDAKELIKFCDLVKEPITMNDARKVIDELDDRGTGTLHFDALCRWFGV
ncbi:hypothetical protein TRFO_35455 [Tritrichomonas foetus]|uniref:EF-hand domain-containing protein n=1 Tax=Tritrichomonas foetus TaxID=1144522 RepID=A0A1J4JG65_9EUKA|nr:hypothetical protein TRFO_35455 [Tritrichomonas foetus]|eukprot:OHS98136.1 hypothetical protein TRFO_35455 [Tritrichomonas foetus]